MPKTRSKRDVPRLTVAFYDDNMEFCKEMARQEHLSVTQFINQLITTEKNKYRRLECENPKMEEM